MFGPLDPISPSYDRISTSDPANRPLSAADFLSGDGSSEGSALLESWQQVVEDQPTARRVDQDVIMKTQRQASQSIQRQNDPSFIEQGQQWVQEGHHASDYEPKPWLLGTITPDPYQHLAHKQGGGTNEHNVIEGALGVQSAAIPWDYRHYSGKLNTHRKAEPLIYTPLVIAKDHDSKSAIDLTSLANHKYQSQRMSSNPQYANTLSALTDYKPIQLHPTDHWLPQMPVAQAPGVKDPKYWEKHFLDLYAPTPPPLLAPVPPQPKRALNAQLRPISLMETKAVELPAILRRGPRVKPLITPLMGANNQPVPFRDIESEQAAMKHSLEVDVFAPAHVDDNDMAFIETEIEMENQFENENEFEVESEESQQLEEDELDY